MGRLLLLVLLSANLSGGDTTKSTDWDSGAKLEKEIDFWIQVYTKYDLNQGLLHDARHPEVIYEVFDLPSNGRAEKELIAQKQAHWGQVLLSLHKKTADGTPSELPDDEHRVFRMFEKNKENNKFLRAAYKKRLRFQPGQRTTFQGALIRSGRYLQKMEQVFRQRGVPAVFTRIPFVESSFNYKAYSKVGASGAWQFIPSTGRIYMTVDPAVDERSDPILSTLGAAGLLKTNFDRLDRWPLAVTAYNHGRKGMLIAEREVGSSRLDDIVEAYRGKRFGFSSRNFFASIAAAVEVEKNAKYFFPELVREGPVDTVQINIPDFIAFSALQKAVDVSERELRELNPALTSEVFVSRLRIPRGFLFQLPAGWGKAQGGAVTAFQARYAAIPKNFKHASQRVLTAQGTYGKQQTPVPVPVTVKDKGVAAKTEEVSSRK